jgi:hypothetical protein
MNSLREKDIENKPNKNHKKKSTYTPSSVPTITQSSHIPTHHSSHQPSHISTNIPTHHISQQPTHKITNNMVSDEPEPNPEPPMNVSMIINDEPEPNPEPPMNISMIIDYPKIKEPEPNPEPPMNVSSFSMNMIETVYEKEASFTYLPFLFVTLFAGIGLIAYKRYKKRFMYVRIPEKDELDI